MKLLEKLTEYQIAFIKKVLGMYITNNIIDEDDVDYVNEYIQGMKDDDEFYYTIDCIVDEVIDEPEWIPVLESELINKDDFTKEEWNKIFKEVLNEINYEYLYGDHHKEMIELNDIIEIEIEKVRIQKEKEEEEERKKNEEERKKKEEEEKRKKETEGTTEDAVAEEIKDESVNDPILNA